MVEQHSLELKERFHRKIIELYETIKVRHGLMIVGGTNSGKSTILTTLQKSLELKSYWEEFNKLHKASETVLEEPQ